MMTSEEYNEAFDALSKMLDEQGLNWIVSQVNSQIRVGKTVEKEVETLRLEKPKDSRQETLFKDNPTYLSGRKAKFTTTINYTAQERLFLLIDAIEHAVVNVADMGHELFNALSDRAIELQEIVFVDENDPEEIRLTRNAVESQHRLGSELKQLLENLRSESR